MIQQAEVCSGHNPLEHQPIPSLLLEGDTYRMESLPAMDDTEEKHMVDPIGRGSQAVDSA